MVGVTALFIATKIEEIHVPQVSTLSYISDGACTSREILKTELLMLRDLKWDLTPITIYNWLFLYVQMAENFTRASRNLPTDLDVSINSLFERNLCLHSFPKFSRTSFSKATELLDLITLDDDSLKFPNHTIATSIIYFVFGEKCATYVSGKLFFANIFTIIKICTIFLNKTYNLKNFF